jgi:hypothetical protein
LNGRSADATEAKSGHTTRRFTNYYENFTVKGHRFRRSLETDDRDTAEILAAKIRTDALLGKLTGNKPEHTLTQALARYWLEHGQCLRSASDIKRLGRVLQDGLGKSVLLSEITASDLTTYAARRRAGWTNRSAQVYAWRHPRSAATTPPAAASRCNSSNTHPTRSRR